MKFLLASTVALSLRTFYADMPRKLRSLGHDVVALASPDSDLDALAEETQTRTLPVAMARRISPLADLRALWRLWRIMRRERPDVVHSMTPKAGLLVMAAARMAGVPVRIHTFTGLVFPTARGMKRRLLKLTDTLTCACATHIIPEGKGVRADLLKNGITRKPLRVIGYGNMRGIDMLHYARTQAIEMAAEDIRRRIGGSFIFIFAGRIVADKGMRELAAAFSRLYARMPGVRLLIVGRREDTIDPVDNETETILMNCQAIHCTGEQSDVRPWMVASDALVFPSYREGFPNVVLEAGAMGLPSIVTDINGSREIISDGVNGFVVPPHDADALYHAMMRMATDQAARNHMAAAARPHIREHWEQEELRRRQLDFYREAAGNMIHRNTTK